MRDQDSIVAAAELIRKKFGRLDVLVNNAGIVGEFPAGTSFEERLKFNVPSQAPLSYVRSVYETNVFGVIAVTQAMLPLLREAPAGRIVNVGSSSGSLTLNANPDFAYRNVFGAAYSPSKAALSATTLAFAIELEKTNIKVNVVCPGFVATDLNDHRGYRTVEQGAKQAVKMALIGPDGPTGTFTDEEGTVPWYVRAESQSMQAAYQRIAGTPNVQSDYASCSLNTTPRQQIYNSAGARHEHHSQHDPHHGRRLWSRPRPRGSIIPCGH